MERPGGGPGREQHRFLEPDQDKTTKPLEDLSPEEVDALADELSNFLADPDNARLWEAVWGTPDEGPRQTVEELVDEYWTKREQETGELRPSKKMTEEELEAKLRHLKWRIAEGIGPEGIDLTDPKNNPDNF